MNPPRNHLPPWCAAALCLVLLAAGCSGDEPGQRLPADAVVLAFGDSVTAGVGAGRAPGYPALLAEATGWQVINGGVSGDTARRAAGRLGPLLAQHRPDLVIVELGGNDFLRRAPPAEVRESLRAIVREARASGATVALVAVPALSLLRAGIGALSDAPIYAELAGEEDVILIADVFADVLSDASLRADAIHPNAQGYVRLADGIRERLAGAGLL